MVKTKSDKLQLQLLELTEKLQELKKKNDKHSKSNNRENLTFTLKLSGTIIALLSGIVSMIPILGIYLFKSTNEYVKYSTIIVFGSFFIIIVFWVIKSNIHDLRINRIRKKMKRIRNQIESLK